MLNKNINKITAATFLGTLLVNYTFGSATFSLASQFAIFASITVFLFIKALKIVGDSLNIGILKARSVSYDDSNPPLLSLDLTKNKSSNVVIDNKINSEKFNFYENKLENPMESVKKQKRLID